MALLTYRRDSLRRPPAERPSMEIGTLRRRFIDLSIGRVAYLRHGTGARSWTKPAVVVWAAYDEFLPLSWGLQLAQDLPTAPDAPVLLPFAEHFWQAEVPETGARVLRDFLDAVPSR